MGARGHLRSRTSKRLSRSLERRGLSRGPQLRTPGLLLGAGLGGFVDGIVLHQILQWHHMLTGTSEYPPTSLARLEVNTVWDGVFHAATWMITVAGILILWRIAQHSPSRLSGKELFRWIVVGWGLFNVVEGVVNHHLLQIHHVREGEGELLLDLAFLGFGVALIALGSYLGRNSFSDGPAAGPP